MIVLRLTLGEIVKVAELAVIRAHIQVTTFFPSFAKHDHRTLFRGLICRELEYFVDLFKLLKAIFGPLIL